MKYMFFACLVNTDIFADSFQVVSSEIQCEIVN
jgi:hypothetical protein